MAFWAVLECNFKYVPPHPYQYMQEWMDNEIVVLDLGNICHRVVHNVHDLKTLHHVSSNKIRNLESVAMLQNTSS